MEPLVELEDVESADSALILDDPPLSRRHAVISALALEGGLGVVSFGIGVVFGPSLLPLCQPTWKDIGFGIAAIVPMALLFFACLHLNWESLREIRDLLDASLPKLLGQCTVLDLAWISLAAGVGEELLFRGIIQSHLAEWFGAAAGLAAASLLFGIAHCITATYAALTALIGAYLGVLFAATGSLVPPILAHATYDFLALIYLLKFRGR